MELTKSYKHLSIEDSNLLKGVSILLIGFHNFFRNVSVPEHIGENEFYFNKTFLPDWVSYIAENPFEWFMSFFAFLGHYGVSAFILISGYGLAMGYKNRETPFFKFFYSRLKKIYPAFFLGVVIAIIIALATNRYKDSSVLWSSVFWKLSLLSPLRPDMMYALYGPWWFFGLIFQLYAAFPLLIFLLKKKYNIAFWSILSTLFVIPHLPFIHGTENYYASALYQLPIFGLGAYLGFQKELKLPKYIVFLALFLVIYGQGNFVFWKFTHISAAILILIFTLWLRNKNFKFNKFIIFTGVLSFHFFIIHPVIRPPFIELADAQNSIYFTTAFSFVYIVISLGVAQVFKIIDNNFRKILSFMKHSK